ncbi:MAG: hypothetical protein PHZ09_00990 [Eubacteriales bacterium]|jgi:ABC-type glycerol-3-phosphate transport system substrate-binding protein|nr:hypothetical protein [Eubacteriales bacterium]
MKKILALLLAAAILLPVMASCSDSTGEAAGTDPVSTAVETGEPDPSEVRKAVSDDLPDADYEGYVFTVLARDRDDFVKDIGAGTEETGDVIVDAIYRRNATVAERFNIVIEAFHTAEPIAKLRQAVQANDDTYGVMLDHVINMGSAALDGNYLDWYDDLPYVNLDKPWYIGNAVDALSVENHAYLMAGEYCLSILRFTYCMYFNKQIAENYNIGDLYGIVMDGKWTIDQLDSIVKQVHEDLDGNGVMNELDMYGFTTDYYSAAVTYQYAFDNPVMTKKEGGIPEMTYNSPKMPDIVDTLIDFFYANEGSYPGDWGVSGPIWQEGRALFLNGLFSSSESYRDFDFDFGIIPYPKWDENQDSYYTMSDGAHDVMAVPISSSNPKRSSVIVEALNAESYKQVIPAYYETALKVKYTRDDESVLVLDMVLDGRTFDFGYVYDGWQGVAFLLQNLTSTNSKDYASAFAGLEKNAITRYEKVVDTLLGLED